MEHLLIGYVGVMGYIEAVCRDLKIRFFAAKASVIKQSNRLKQSKVKTEKTTANERAKYYLDHYGESMLRLAYSYLHNYADAEEVIQDAIMKMLSTSNTYENVAHEKSYLLTIVSNLSKNRIKYNKVRETDELSEELVGSSRDDLSYVWDAVKHLSLKYREVIHLFYVEGYSTAEIASILSANENTVRSNLSRARVELKAILKEEYDFE